MTCNWKVLCQLCIIHLATAKVTYFHEHSYIEIQPPDVNHETDFGYSMRYSKKRNSLLIGAPHHDLSGKLFTCSTTDVFTHKTLVSTEVDIDMDKLAGDYSRELAPGQHFCLGSSIAVASDFFLTCAPLWRAVRNSNDTTGYKYGTYGTCFVITEEGTRRLKGAYEQISEMQRKSINNMLSKVHSGSGWSTFIDEANNLTLISLSPYSHIIDIGYMDTSPPLSSMKFMNINKSFKNLFKNIGSFVSGTFFDPNIVIYAFSSRRQTMDGVVVFLQKPTGSKRKWEVMDYHNRRPLFIEASDFEIGSMFGAALCAADLNHDSFSDLLVGAPAHAKLEHATYNSGALHIFLGGNKEKIKEKRTILATKSGGYFGTTIATTDVDGDELAEIFVSAPYEDSGIGAIYVLNGNEILNFINNNIPSTEILLSQLKLTQRIQNAKFKSFGYSLQPLPDLDENGCSELAVGAPNSGKVLVYRSLPTMLVNVSAELDRDYVRETDRNCSIRLVINIKYPTKLVNISESLTVNVSVTGKDVSMNDTFEQTLNPNQSTYDKNISVAFTENVAGLYVFNATVTMSFDSYLANEVFDKSKVGLSPYSKTTVTLPINRRGAGEDWRPILKSNIQFSGGNDNYTLGTSPRETVTIEIRNEGNETLVSCAKILIEGSKGIYINAQKDSTGWYQYMLPKPFEKSDTDVIEIQLDMSTHSNLDKKFHVKVALYNICNRGNFSVDEKEISFSVNPDQLYIEGSSYEQNITDTKIFNNESALISADHVYTVINEGNMTWKSINAIIKIQKEKFIRAYHISNQESLNCEVKDNNLEYSFTCNFDLQKYLKIVITVDIAKDMFKLYSHGIVMFWVRRAFK